MQDFSHLTPAMRQYMQVKQRYPGCLLLFRMGDFYETFYDDAKTAARELEITLTSRGKGEKKAPLAGIPYHALDSYLARLVKKGFKVAICEQIENPKFAKGIVKRDVVRIVTPGTLIDNSMLDATSNNYIMAVNVHGEKYAAALCDLSTGEFIVCSQKVSELDNNLIKYAPSECIIPTSLGVNKEFCEIVQKRTHIETQDDRHFRYDLAYEMLKKQFKVLNLEGYGIQEDKLTICAAGALLHYLQATQFKELSHIQAIKKQQTKDVMVLDPATMRNLELIEQRNLKNKTGSLLHVLDKTKTAMGARLLKKCVKEPLLSVEKINKRLDATERLKKDTILRKEISAIIKKIQDLERLISRVNYGNANPKDLLAIKTSLQQLPLLQAQQRNIEECALLKELLDFPLQESIVELLEKALVQDPPVSIRDGGIIKPSYNEELQRLYEIKDRGKEFLLEIEQREKEKTNIKNLKIGFNRIFGYFLEVPQSNTHLVPKEYIRKQTTTKAERYITPELKEYEEQVLTAQEKIKEIEYEIFQSLLQEIAKKTKIIQLIASNIAGIDVLCSFAQVAQENNYHRPTVNNEKKIVIENARHPVIEMIEENFIANDIELNDSEMMIITGPNMAGKSTIMRQVALNVLLAQIGSFVAAQSATIGIVDRIFTRVGAQDDLTKGQSTFMVEMNETANILHNATNRSLIILDEIGRGTSTFDGIAIAWSVAEHIYNKIKAKTLFATHYHVLNKLESEFEFIKNYNVLVKETQDDFIFLRKLVKGGTDKSYGIHVGRLAGLPEQVILRAEEIQDKLNEQDSMKSKIEGEKNMQQKTLFVQDKEEIYETN